MQPGARPADIAGEQGQRDQAAGVVSAKDMLADAHAPEEHGRFRLAETASEGGDFLGGNAGERLGHLGRVVGDSRLECLEALGTRLDEVAVMQAFGDDDLHDGVIERDVRAGLDLAVLSAVRGDARAADVDGKQCCPRGRGLFHERGGHGVVRGGVAAGDHGHLGVLDIPDDVGDRPGADPFDERIDR